MVVNIHSLIAAISPDAYCTDEKKPDEKESPRAKVKKMIADETKKLNEKIAKKKKVGLKILSTDYDTDIYIKAAEVAKPVEARAFDWDKEFLINPMLLPGIKNPFEQHKIVYEADDALLEQIYIWIIDNIIKRDFFEEGTEKLVDNFVASPGSSYFGEWSTRASQMQQQATSMLGAANQVLKSVLNLIYDLREFKLRLDPYDKLKSKKEVEKEAAILSLKQIWLDTVDMKRGNTAIKALAVSGREGPGFVTLLDAFMAADIYDLEKVKKMDLNEIVKKVLLQRVFEFNKWITESENDLKKRFEIEKVYLKSQVNSVRLYSRWIKPYLKAATLVEQRGSPSAALVAAFNMVLFELVLIAKHRYQPAVEVKKGLLPKMFETYKTYNSRKYIPMAVVEVNFRSTPTKVGQHHRYTGKAEITFTSYALNDDELALLRNQLEKDDLGDAMKFIEGATEESLKQIKDDIEEFIGEGEKKEEEEEKKKKEAEETNPFSALFSFFTKPKEEKKEKALWPIVKDGDYEKVIRSGAIIDARRRTLKTYNEFKKANNMVT